LHPIGKEVAAGVSKAHIKVLQPQKWYRCIEAEKVDLNRIFPTSPQPPHRFNHAGQTAFYLADDPRTAVIEVKQEDILKEVRVDLWIVAFEISSPLRVLDARMPMLSGHKRQPSILQTLLTRSFLREKRRDKGRFQPQYLLTRFVADLVRKRNLDGIYYTSCHEYPYRDDVYGTNLVIFNSEYKSFTSAAAPTRVSWSREDDPGLGFSSMVVDAMI
jgi:RES domain